MEFAAVVLTGGTGRRLGGADKAVLVVDGQRLLDRALAAVAGAADVVVVGPEVDGVAATFTREDPPGGGPAAAVTAGLAALPPTPDWVVVLAVDMPWITADTVARLATAAAENGRGAVLASGDRRHLCAVLHRGSVTGGAAGTSWRRLLPEGIAECAAQGREAHDIDTWDDLKG